MSTKRTGTVIRVDGTDESAHTSARVRWNDGTASMVTIDEVLFRNTPGEEHVRFFFLGDRVEEIRNGATERAAEDRG